MIRKIVCSWVKYPRIFLVLLLVMFFTRHGRAEDTVTGKIIAPGEMTARDKEMVRFAKQAAAECSKVLEDAVDRGIKSEKELFSTLYFPILPVTNPPRFTPFYDDYADESIRPVLARYLDKDNNIVTVIMVDINGYLPTHNTVFSQPLIGNPAVDILKSGAKRISNGLTAFRAAKNRAEFLLQTYYRDTGEILTDVSVPVYVKKKHWGALRIAYLRDK
jgi:hypothetical protein